LKKLRKDSTTTSLETNDFEQLFLPDAEPKESRQSELLQDNLLARPEMHMFLRPYFFLDKHADRSIGIDSREVVCVNGKKIERRWCVKPDSEYGMPGPLEAAVLLVLYEIAYERYISKRTPVPEVMHIGSLRSFIQRLGMSYCGKTAAAVKLALKRLVHTSCTSENSFFDKSKNLFLTESFHLLRGVGITGDTDGKGDVIEETFVTFDDRIRRNLNSRYLMVLDLVFLRKCKSDIAKHLYPLLIHWLWRSSQQGYWRVEYQWLAQHLGIKTWDKLWRAKNQLKEANENMQEMGYIAAYKWDGWTLLYFPGEKFQETQQRRAAAKENIPVSTTSVKSPNQSRTVIEYDPLLPVLNLFAAGNPLAERGLKDRGLTAEQAEALCIEKGIHVTIAR